MCEPIRTAGQWTSAKEPHLHSTRSHTNPTEAAVEWSSNTKCPSPSQCTHTMTVSHAHVREALRHSLKYTLSHTPTDRKRKTQENNNNRIPTAHKALTIQ
ncbi:uncharacterized protein TM35_000181760 [Trypanosoma theileri]|uniref:Uncharacterized protein n=1 Tax=Trypanosoma theileri TaxID=67003 RepID=A0A1X0NV85_9TRYP|nr:uncharacterized protein TM35_000181760 [Trypanosoma theileri]ORC88119.1 hypothetical protein TM35_000181760 [Trypanosoma theileri]